jgi:hypothetical protein
MGSLYLFDLNNLNTNPNQALQYDYVSMAKQEYKEEFEKMD